MIERSSTIDAQGAGNQAKKLREPHEGAVGALCWSGHESKEEVKGEYEDSDCELDDGFCCVGTHDWSSLDLSQAFSRAG